MRQKILITGGAGFQGSHLAEHFLNCGYDYDVTILNTFSKENEKNLSYLEKKPNIVWGSVTDPEIVKKTVKEHDIVLHLAAYVNVDESIKNPGLTLKVNIEGTYNILEAVRENKNKLIYASTCEVYGASTQQELIDENTELKPHSPYAASKASADRLCFSYFKTYGLDISIIRPFNIFGPRQKEGEFGALIPILVKRALEAKDLIIFGTGEQTRDYMYIDDVIQAYDLMVKTKNTAGEVYNFGTGIETSIKKIAEYIAKKLGVTIQHKESRPGEVSHFCADITKAKKLLGFQPKINIWEGIDRYILWRKNQK